MTTALGYYIVRAGDFQLNSSPHFKVGTYVIETTAPPWAIMTQTL